MWFHCANNWGQENLSFHHMSQLKLLKLYVVMLNALFIFLPNKQINVSAGGKTSSCFIVYQNTDALINNSCFDNIHDTFEATNCWETKQSASISVNYSSSLHEKSFLIGASGFYSRLFGGEWFHSNYIINLSNNNRQWFWEAAGYQ